MSPGATPTVSVIVPHYTKAFAEIARALKPGGAHIYTGALLSREKRSSEQNLMEWRVSRTNEARVSR